MVWMVYSSMYPAVWYSICLGVRCAIVWQVSLGAETFEFLDETGVWGACDRGESALPCERGRKELGYRQTIYHKISGSKLPCTRLG